MKVRIDLGLDFEGHHTLDWHPSQAAGAIEVPRAALERWAAEREAFKLASLRWKRVIEEVEEQLYRAESERTADLASATPQLEVVGAKTRVRRR